MTVILALDRDLTQTELANLIRAHWAELWAMKPAERRARIDEILNARKPSEITNVA